MGIEQLPLTRIVHRLYTDYRFFSFYLNSTRTF